MSTRISMRAIWGVLSEPTRPLQLKHQSDKYERLKPYRIQGCTVRSEAQGWGSGFRNTGLLQGGARMRGGGSIGDRTAKTLSAQSQLGLGGL